VYIVHDPEIDYIADISIRVLMNDPQALATYKSIEAMIQAFNKLLLPSHLSGYLDHAMSFKERGSFLFSLLVKDAAAIVCHSDYAADLIREAIRRDVMSKTIVSIPLAYDVSSNISGKPESQPPADSTLSVGIYGMFFNDSKNMDLLLDVLEALIGRRQKVAVWLAGRLNQDLVSIYNDKITRIGGSFIPCGFLSDQDLDQKIQHSDFIWAYRYPTCGESSDTVLRAMANGCCPIVCNVGSYSELPSDLVLKLPPGSAPIDIATEIHTKLDCTHELFNERITYIKTHHSSLQYVNRLVSAAHASTQLQSTSLIGEEAPTSDLGLLLRGILTPSVLSTNPSSRFIVDHAPQSLYHIISRLEGSLEIYLDGFEDRFRNLYLSAASPVSIIQQSFFNPYHMRTRYDYLYCIVKMIMNGELDPAVVIPIRESQIFPTSSHPSVVSAQNLLAAFERSLDDYTEWHDNDSSRSTSLLSAVINLFALELLPLLWSSSAYGGDSLVNPQAALSESLICYTIARAMLDTKIPHKAEQSKVTLSRAFDIISCLFSASSSAFLCEVL
jgi:glycosyltransferase involved in cell wall biosynthesis